nr:unnamed protein product [Callosobruchus analis]
MIRGICSHWKQPVAYYLVNSTCPDGAVVTWEFVRKFYDQDKNYDIRAAPKLTDVHICPANFEKMKVKYATQVFSNLLQ